MNHEYINQFGLVDEYLMGRLPAAESELFEEHFVDCPECVARLKLAGDLVQDLRRSPFYPQPEEAVRPRRTLVPFLPALWSKPLVIGVCSAALVIAVCLPFGMNWKRGLQAEVDRANSRSAELENRYQEELRASALSEKSRQEAEKSRQEIEEKLGQTEAKLRQEQQRSANKSSSGGRSILPQINFPSLILRSYRDVESRTAEIELPKPPASFMISVPLEGELNYADYRMTISDHGEELWKQAGFKPDRNDSLSAGFSASFFPPGDYVLDLEGRTKENQWEDVGSYNFRLIKPGGAR